MENYSARFLEAAEHLCPALRAVLSGIPKSIQGEAQEIRLRIGGPVTVCTPERIYYVTGGGVTGAYEDRRIIRATRQNLTDTLAVMCSYSLYTHQNELSAGFISLRGGHRAGVCGTAVSEGKNITALRDIASINLRIGQQIIGCASALFGEAAEKIDKGLLLAGAPSSGKTTLLRDIVRTLSCQGRRVAVIDERGEIGAVYRGERGNDLGPNCDLLNGYPKAQGILHALRGLSPEWIVCDELGGAEDEAAVEQGLHAGVAFIAAVHAGGRLDLVKKTAAQRLLATGAFETVALLKDRHSPGKIHEIYKAGDLLDSDNRRTFPGDGRDGNWLYRIQPSRPAG